MEDENTQTNSQPKSVFKKKGWFSGHRTLNLWLNAPFCPHKVPFNNFLSLVFERSFVSSKILKFVNFVTNKFQHIEPSRTRYWTILEKSHFLDADFKILWKLFQVYRRLEKSHARWHLWDAFLITNYIILSTLTCNFCDFLA